MCKLCVSDYHKGHLIITYDYLNKAEKQAGSAVLSDKVLKMFGEEEEKIYNLVVKVHVCICSHAAHLLRNLSKYAKSSVLNTLSSRL